MRLRLLLWACVMSLCIASSSCNTRSTPASPSSSNQAQPTPESASQPSSTPVASEDKAPVTQSAAKEKKGPADQNTGSHLAQTAPKTVPTPAPTPPSQPVILPAGMVLSVRINETVGSKTSKTGDKFTASIAQPVVIRGQTVIPAHSTAAGVVEQAQQGGKIKGSSALALRLTSITVKGIVYPVSTGSFLQEGKGKGSRTAKAGGGGAAAGALIGGIAGGGKGALIGTAVGAGTGVAGSAFTGNKELTIPAESILQFKLAQPLRLSPENNSTAPSNPTQDQ
jgi:hypothetical protein